MEQLSKQKTQDLKIGSKEKKVLTYASGPFVYQGSNEFACMYRENDEYVYRQIIYSLPDST